MTTEQDIKVRVITEKAQPTEETFPQVTKALLTRLEKTFPDSCPDRSMPDREIWYKAGQVSVVTYLRIENDRQTNQ